VACVEVKRETQPQQLARKLAAIRRAEMTRTTGRVPSPAEIDEILGDDAVFMAF
jgi:hypothetical protein